MNREKEEENNATAKRNWKSSKDRRQKKKGQHIFCGLLFLWLIEE
jgi:hypothetical protein